MIIAGIQKNSFVDFPGKVSAVVFTQGCNLNCFYCHNHELIGENCNNPIKGDILFDMLSERKGFLDGVVVSGGEPTLQGGLINFQKKIKDMGYSVKLDTNGTKPEILEEIIKMGLVDYIAMDVKAPLGKYGKICRTDLYTDRIKESIDLLKCSGVDYEFRTTIAPGLNADDLCQIAQSIAGARLFVLQKCREVEGLDFKSSIPSQYLSDIMQKVQSRVDKVVIRGVAI
ncbi:MAG: anaerobic ribonucleoside-triphosphate reductase activating protein [Clostridium sp.]|nr:anaerobic ribonucleoside-triphosphate reductase activating protein [Clostridium sp.]